jgi:hypothetical protein
MISLMCLGVIVIGLALVASHYLTDASDTYILDLRSTDTPKKSADRTPRCCRPPCRVPVIDADQSSVAQIALKLASILVST